MAVSLVGCHIELPCRDGLSRCRHESLKALEIDLHIHVLAVRLEAGILEPAGLGIHDIREDLVAQDLGLAERASR